MLSKLDATYMTTTEAREEGEREGRAALKANPDKLVTLREYAQHGRQLAATLADVARSREEDVRLAYWQGFEDVVNSNGSD